MMIAVAGKMKDGERKVNIKEAKTQMHVKYLYTRSMQHIPARSGG